MFSKQEEPIKIALSSGSLSGDISIPHNFNGMVLFAHDGGRRRNGLRNKYVATVMQESGLATLLFDLLTEEEDVIDERTSQFRFDIPLLADRLVQATDSVLERFDVSDGDNLPPVGYFGASTGAAAALIAAAKRSDVIKAVVSRGGHPDLAGPFLQQVRAPTLLIVGGDDKSVIDQNSEAINKLHCLKEREKRLAIIPEATHLFEEPGKLEQVAKLASDWFLSAFKNRGSINPVGSLQERRDVQA